MSGEVKILNESLNIDLNKNKIQGMLAKAEYIKESLLSEINRGSKEAKNLLRCFQPFHDHLNSIKAKIEKE